MKGTHSFPVRDDLTSPSPLVGEGRGGGNASMEESRTIGKDISVIRARNLRKNLTEVEKKLWYWLRRQNLQEARFRRQAPIGRYIVDFACYDPKLIIELDGGQHADQQHYDEKRDAWLKSEGFHVLRFWNHEVVENVEGVLQVIMDGLNALRVPPLPNPPPRGGRGS